MIDITNLSYYLGDRALYDEASLFIGPKDKIGLIGLNGTGVFLLRLLGLYAVVRNERTQSYPESYSVLRSQLRRLQKAKPQPVHSIPATGLRRLNQNGLRFSSDVAKQASDRFDALA